MMKKWLVARFLPILLLFVSLISPVGSSLQPSLALQPTRAAEMDNGIGFNVDGIGLDGPGQGRMFDRIGETHFGWIRQQVRWSSYEPVKGQFQNGYVAQVDTLVGAAAAKGYGVLLSVVNSPDWAGEGGGLPHNARDFGDFMRFITARYQGKVRAYEIWNEQNLAYETGGLVDVGSYLAVLKQGYKAVKGVDPGTLVVFGGLVPNGIVDHPDVALDDITYLKQIYKVNNGEVRKYYDVLGAHAEAACNPPDSAWPDDPPTTPCGTDADGTRAFTADNPFYFKRIAQLRAVMEQHGEGEKPIWVTEFGWSSMAQPDSEHAFAAYVTEQQQARYLVRALEIGQSYDWVGVMFVWNLNFQVTSNATDEKWGYGILRPDWSPRPAFTALKNVHG